MQKAALVRQLFVLKKAKIISYPTRLLSLCSF